MSFIRSFEEKQIDALQSEQNKPIYNLLISDIKDGKVFPSVRKNQIYFYYEGGCLYKFANGKFTRDKAYEKYGYTTKNSTQYETAKTQVENKFSKGNKNDKERRLLNALYRYTYSGEKPYDTVVLDIEVNLNGALVGRKKCDLVLYNTQTYEIMFVEGKIFSDRRVNVRRAFIPEVISQVNTYSTAIAEQQQVILTQYVNHIEIINNLFGMNYSAPKNLIQPAKLLVYDVPLSPTDNGIYSINTVTASLGKNNVVWFKQNERPTTDEIWNILCK
jgi:hypothetical protein